MKEKKPTNEEIVKDIERSTGIPSYWKKIVLNCIHGLRDENEQLSSIVGMIDKAIAVEIMNMQETIDRQKAEIERLMEENELARKILSCSKRKTRIGDLIKEKAELQKQVDELTVERQTLGSYNNIAMFYAEILFNADYRKIHNNAVVLTDKQDIQQFEWSKLVDKMGIIKFAEKIREETAEKFAERLKGEEHLLYGQQREIKICNIRHELIDEIAKDLTDAVKTR